jgi:hypothetical protein
MMVAPASRCVVIRHAWGCGERIPCPFGTPECARFAPYRPGERIRTPYGGTLLLCHGCGRTRAERAA